MIDISAAKAKARSSVRVRDENDTGYGNAGVEQTRKEPVLLLDHQNEALTCFAMLLRASQRDAFRRAVLSRLSGVPGDAAVRSCIAAVAVADYGFTMPQLTKLGIANTVKRGNWRLAGGSKESNRDAIT
jgi:hypothetical protein